MNHSLSTRSVAWSIAAFLVAALPHLTAMPAWLGGLVVGACTWRLAAAHAGWRPPHWLIRTTLTVVGVGLVLVAFGSLWGRRAATGLLCLMIAAKMMEMWRFRDARMVAALGFFLVAAQFLFSQRLVFLFYLLAACWISTAALMAIQRDAEGGMQRPLALASRALILMVAAVPLATTLFVLFPRLAQPIWGVPDHVLDGRTGLSETMSPGSIASLFADDSPAFRVEFDGPVPPARERYWRGPVLWRFDGATWRRLFFSSRPAERYPDAADAPWRYRIQLEPTERRWLLALDYPAAWPDDATLTADYQLVRRQPVTGLISYGVTSQPNFVDTPLLISPLRRAALELPEGRNPRTRARAGELRRQHPDDRELIDAVLEWFNTGNFEYSLETMPLGRHGADELLFDLRTGYCEYYASAFVVLMRSAGIPARIVTGYQGGFWQAGGEYLLVRQSDAHAWAEVWLEGEGWIRVDPTFAVSPSRINDGARSALNASRGLLDMEWVYRLRNRYDRLQRTWNDWVLNFDADRQQRMLSRFGLDRLGPMGVTMLLLLAVVIVCAPVTWWLWRRVSTTPQRGAWREWERIRRRLTRAGIPPNPGETPREFARRAGHFLANGDDLAGLVEWFYRLHYGTGDPQGLAAFRARARSWRPQLNSHSRAAVQQA